MVTAFGKVCRKMRIDSGELLSDMAEKLGVSAAFLSKVENGRRKPPKEWEEKIIEMYHLQGEKKSEFEDSFFRTLNADSIDIKNFNDADRDLMLSFARKFSSLDKNALRKIMDE